MNHGVPGQVNVMVLDVDSDITSYGRHNRLLVFRGTGDESHLITVREDMRGLPMSTDDDRRRAARGWQRLHPVGTRLVHVGSEEYDAMGGRSVEHVYRIERAGKVVTW